MDRSESKEWMTPSSVYLSKDGKSVFLGIPDMKPVMQMRLGWALATREGVDFGQNTYFTPYELTRFDPQAEGFEPLTVDLRPRGKPVATAPAPVTVEEGKRVSELMGCVACHSTDGSTIGKVGPTWKGLFGNSRVFADGGTSHGSPITCSHHSSEVRRCDVVRPAAHDVQNSRDLLTD